MNNLKKIVLTEDFKDGIMLVQLCEALSGKSIGKYTKTKPNALQARENLSKVRKEKKRKERLKDKKNIHVCFFFFFCVLKKLVFRIFEKRKSPSRKCWCC